MTIVKSCWHNFTLLKCKFHDFFCSISYRPTDLLLLKQFSKNVSFSNIYNLISECALLSTLKKSVAKVICNSNSSLVSCWKYLFTLCKSNIIKCTLLRKQNFTIVPKSQIIWLRALHCSTDDRYFLIEHVSRATE